MKLKLKVGDSVLYLARNLQHTGIITGINKDLPQWPYEVHWVNDQNTNEPEDEMLEYRKQYLEALGK